MTKPLSFVNTLMTLTELRYVVKQCAKRNQLVKGILWDSWRREGSAVGCQFRHDRKRDEHWYWCGERVTGVPAALYGLENVIFQGLPHGADMAWPSRFVGALKRGVDYSSVCPRFAVWMIDDPEYGMMQLAQSDESREAVKFVASLYERDIAGDAPEAREWADACGITGLVGPPLAHYASRGKVMEVLRLLKQLAYSRDDHYIAHADKLISLIEEAAQ